MYITSQTMYIQAPLIRILDINRMMRQFTTNTLENLYMFIKPFST